MRTIGSLQTYRVDMWHIRRAADILCDTGIYSQHNDAMDRVVKTLSPYNNNLDHAKEDHRLMDFMGQAPFQDIADMVYDISTYAGKAREEIEDLLLFAHRKDIPRDKCRSHTTEFMTQYASEDVNPVVIIKRVAWLRGIAEHGTMRKRGILYSNMAASMMDDLGTIVYCGQDTLAKLSRDNNEVRVRIKYSTNTLPRVLGWIRCARHELLRSNIVSSVKFIPGDTHTPWGDPYLILIARRRGSAYSALKILSAVAAGKSHIKY